MTTVMECYIKSAQIGAGLEIVNKKIILRSYIYWKKLTTRAGAQYFL